MQVHPGQLVESRANQDKVLYRVEEKMADGRFMVIQVYPLADKRVRQYFKEYELLSAGQTLFEVMICHIELLESENQSLRSEAERLKNLELQRLEPAGC